LTPPIELFYDTAMTTDYQKTHFALLDLQYSYLDDGYTLFATTDVPCHLYCRMTEQPPHQHTLPSIRRGTRFTGDVRFCFTVYEDNDQVEAGDTLTHTFIKDKWEVCHDRWFYFVGTIGGKTLVSETAIFKFHFPAPPPPVPGAMLRVIFANLTNRTVTYSWGTWPITHNTINGRVLTNYDAPNYLIPAGDQLTASYHIFRGFLDFSTAILPDTIKILSAAISVYIVGIFANVPARPWLYVTRGVQHLPPISSDYGGQLPFTEILGKIDLGTVTLNAYNDIPLNAAGIARIDPLSTTRFCLRGQNDVEDFASLPIYNNYIWFRSRQIGITKCALLKINYYPAERPC